MLSRSARGLLGLSTTRVPAPEWSDGDKALFRGIRGHLETLLFCSVCLVPRADLGQDSGASFAPELTNQETFPSAVNCLKGHSRFLSLWLSAPCWGERPVRMEGQLRRKKCRGGRRGGCAGRGGAEFRQGPPPAHTSLDGTDVSAWTGVAVTVRRRFYRL